MSKPSILFRSLAVLALYTTLLTYSQTAKSGNEQLGVGNVIGNNNDVTTNIIIENPEKKYNKKNNYMEEMQSLRKIRNGESIYIFNDRYQVHLIAANYLWGCILHVAKGEQVLLSRGRRAVGGAFNFNLKEAAFELRVTKINFSSCEFDVQNIQLHNS